MSRHDLPSQTSDEQSCHDDPSHQSGYIHHQTTYQGYTNQGQHASDGGAIYNVQVKQKEFNPLKELHRHCSPSAAFDSAARFNPPRCAESTRRRIIRIIYQWINSKRRSTAVPSSLFWLHGGAGVGKSALAQILSEKFQKEKRLAASFFFFRSDPARNNGQLLIPTLVSHLILTIEDVAPFVEQSIRKRPTLFTTRFQTQIQELLIEPLLALESSGALVPHPLLIVIDGLDECENPDVQVELLRIVARAITQIPYPLRFLITSRPEAHITHTFDHDPDLQAVAVHKYNLSDDPDADMDIHNFLEKAFEKIRRVHRLGRYLPDAWPDQKVITSLVDQSSGHFIHASTVIGFIQSEKHRPDERLEVILRLRLPREGDRPYAQLDALYTLIFQGVESQEQLEKICLVLGILYFRSKGIGLLHACTIEGLLRLKAGDLVLLLDPILSLVELDGRQVHILHKSLFDYLLDFTRGGHLPFDLSRVHEIAATHILNRKIVKGICDRETYRYFAYHCRHATCHDKSLRKCLHSLEIPYSRQLTPPHDFDLWSQEIIWSFFRALSRKGFDSTGQAHAQYAAKWMGYFPSQVTLRPTYAMSREKVSDLKREFDKLLREWKPKNHPSLIDIEMDSASRLSLIKQEHIVFSAHANAPLFGDNIVSSLVLGDYFVHSYHFWVEPGSMDIRTYSRYGYACYKSLGMMAYCSI